MRKIERIIIHCSDTPSTMDIGVEEINEWHSKKPGYMPSSNGLYCGYHWIIRRNGELESGRLESDTGAHAVGYNHNSIGICLVGRGEYTTEQWENLYWLIAQKIYQYGVDTKQVIGHCEVNQNKSCPMFKDMDKFRDQLEIYINKELGGS